MRRADGIMDLKVMKFGGSVLRNRGDFGRASDIIIKELDRSSLPVCVVSAMKGVTDEIAQAVNAVRDDRGFDPHRFVEGLYAKHLGALPPTCDDSSGLKAEFDELGHVLAYMRSSRELNGSAHAFAISRGEAFSCRILSQHLSSRGVESRCFYGEELLVTDDNCMDALVNLEETKEKLGAALAPCFEDTAVPIIAGFSGRSPAGRITILGRGGSDDTAVCVAFCLGAKEVVKYVDQEGIMTIDPKFLESVRENHSEVNEKLRRLPTPKVVPYLSYVEASELMREERIKVVHYKVLNPLMRGRIRFHVKDVSRPEENGTVIGPEAENHGTRYGMPKAISFQRNLYGIRFLPTQSRTPTEVYAKVFEALSSQDIDIRYISISGYQISLLMPETDVKRALNVLKALDIAMDVSPLKGRKGTFSIVGTGMRGVKGLLSKVTGVVAEYGINIEQATQPNSENIIRFSIDDEDIPMAVSAVYSKFFK